MCTRVGFALFIAYLNIVVNAFMAIGLIVLLANKKLFEETITDPSGSLDVDKLRKIVRVIFVICIIVSIFVMALSAMMVKGINMRRHRLMSPWLIVWLISIVFYIMYNIYMFSALKSGTQLASGIFSTVIQCIVVYPIYTLYRDFREESKIVGRRM